MIVLDIESSGLDERDNCILSIGAVEYESDAEFYGECYAYDNKLISQAALDINGFTYAQATDKKKQSPHDLVYNFYKWSMERQYGQLLAGQQVGSFDIKFIKYIFDNHLENIKWPYGYRSLDLHSVAFSKWCESLSLDQILVKCGLQPESKPHNALNGARLEKAAFKYILG